MTSPRPLAPALALLLGACRATPPSTLETAFMNQVKHRLTVGNGPPAPPWLAASGTVEKGRQAFGGYCVACHGPDGHATGVPFAAAMSPPVPDLGSAAVQAYSDRQLRWIVEHGLAPSGMPGAQGLLGDEEMWRIVAFLRHLPPPASPPGSGG